MTATTTTTVAAPTTLDQALEYAALGWPVVPLHWPTSYGDKEGPNRAACSCQRADCESQGKHPRTRNGLKDATTDPDQIRRWWKQWPTANIGIRTGDTFDVVDLDTPDAAAALAAAGLDVDTLDGPTVNTGRGRHYYVAPADRGNRSALVPGVDIRGEGGYVVAPPSMHYTGSAYTWGERGPEAPPPECRRLSALLVKAEIPAPPLRLPPATPRGHQDGRSGYAEATIPAALGRVATAAEGARNDQLNASAYTLGRIVAAGEIDRADAEERLLANALAAGLGEPEAEATIRSGLDNGTAAGPTPAHRDSLDLVAARRPAEAARSSTTAPPDGDDPEPEPVPLNLPPEFWDSRPVLSHVRDAAWNRRLSPDAVLAALLARVAAATPPAYRLPPIVGHAASVNLYVALTGPSGSGKSTAIGLAEELLPIDRDDVVKGGQLGTGEGLIEAYMGKKDGERQKVKNGAFFSLDEGAALADLGQRKGATVLSVLRSMWSGGSVGQNNASGDTTRQLAGGSYSLGFVIGIQPKLAGHLLSDDAAGTPQRFIWARTIDPSIPKARPQWPGIVTWTPPQLPRNRPEGSQFSVHPDIADEIDSAVLARNRGEIACSPLDSHRDLSRLKVAALLALLDDRLDVNPGDWHLARTVLEASDAVRADAISTVRWSIEEQERARDRSAARRATEAAKAVNELAETEYQKALDSSARTAWKVVDKDGRATRRDINTAIGGRRRKVVPTDDAIEHAISLGWLVATDDDGIYAAGSVVPE